MTPADFGFCPGQTQPAIRHDITSATIRETDAAMLASLIPGRSKLTQPVFRRPCSRPERIEGSQALALREPLALASM
jgi:hypothetical protein